MPAMQDAADATLWFTTAHLRVSSWQSGAYSISDVFVANENHDSSSFWPSEVGGRVGGRGGRQQADPPPSSASAQRPMPETRRPR